MAPLTATVLSSVEDHHAGIASGVNNAVARSAQLMAVAAIPLAAGITGDSYRDPVSFSDSFMTAMIISASLAVGGAVLAWVTLGDRRPSLRPPVSGRQPPALRPGVAAAVEQPVYDTLKVREVPVNGVMVPLSAFESPWWTIR